MSQQADLHCHSIYSDGELSPHSLIDRAEERGLNGLSITDHDSISGYNELLFLYAQKKKISLIPGVEISTLCEGMRLHILGYSFSLSSPEMIDFLQSQQTARMMRNQAILDKLHHQGIEISHEEIQATLPQKKTDSFQALSLIGRPHIAMAMLKKGVISRWGEAFSRYIGDSCCCYQEGSYSTTECAIDVIHQAGGKAVIAHPHIIKQKSLIRKIQTLPFDGIEVYYGKMLLHQCQKWKEIAEKKKWMMTGGSDFHGSMKPEVNLGDSYCPEKEFLQLHRHAEPFLLQMYSHYASIYL